jgi:hypothetical protein
MRPWKKVKFEKKELPIKKSFEIKFLNKSGNNAINFLG